MGEAGSEALIENLLNSFTEIKVEELKKASMSGKVVVVGPPCSGKTSIIKKVESEGLKVEVEEVTPLPQRGKKWSDALKKYEDKNVVVVALTPEIIKRIEEEKGLEIGGLEKDLEQVVEDYFGLKYYPPSLLKLMLENRERFRELHSIYREVVEKHFKLFDENWVEKLKNIVRSSSKRLVLEDSVGEVFKFIMDLLGVGLLALPIQLAIKATVFAIRGGRGEYETIVSFIEFLNSWKEMDEGHKQLLVSKIAAEHARDEEGFKKLKEELYEQIEALASPNNLDKLRKEIEKIREVYDELKSELDELKKEFEPIRGISGFCLTPEELGIDLKAKKLESRDGWNDLADFPDKGKEIVDKVLKALREKRVVILRGKKGIGKSTLARYSLAKALEEKLVTSVLVVESIDASLVIRIGEVAKKYGITVLFDPSPPLVYERGEMKPLRRVTPVLEPLVDFMNWGVGVVAVLPDDLYKSLEGLTGNMGVSLEELRNRGKLVEIEVDLRDLDFLERVVKAYSGCSGDVARAVAEKIINYDAYTLVAKYAGLNIKDRGCDASRLLEALEDGKGNAKKFLTYIVLDTLIARANDNVGRLLAVYPALVLHTIFGPLPSRLTELLAEKLVAKELPEARIGIDNYFRQQLTKWFTQRKEDLVQEVLEDLVIEGESYEYLQNDIERARRKLEEIGLKLQPKHTVIELALKKTLPLLFEELSSLTKRLSTECWARATYIIGCAITGYYHNYVNILFNDYKRLRELPEIADKCEEADSLLLVEDEIPVVIPLLISLLLGRGENPLEPIGETQGMINRVKEYVEKEGPLPPTSLVPYIAGLALASLKQQPNEALYLFGKAIFEFGPYTDPIVIANTFYIIGEKLKWPDELALFFDIIVDEYSTRVKELPNLFEALAGILLNNKNLEAWSKAYLAKALAKLALLKYDGSLAVKALKLLDEIREKDPVLATLMRAEVNLIFLQLYANMGMLEEAKEYLRRSREDLDHVAKEVFEKDLSNELKKYFMSSQTFYGYKHLEEHIKQEFKALELRWKGNLASLYFKEGLEKGDKKIIENAGKILQEVAKDQYEMKDYRNYILSRIYLLRLHALLVDDISEFEKLLPSFHELLKDARELLYLYNPDNLILYSNILAFYIITTALVGRDWKELLKQHGSFLKSLNPFKKVATLLLLSLLTRNINLKPSNQEIYKAIKEYINPSLRPALKLRLSLINEEKALLECLRLASRADMQRCIQSVTFVSVSAREGESEPLEVAAPESVKATFILLLKALTEENWRLARAHALRASSVTRVTSLKSPFICIYDTLDLEAGGLNEKVELYLAKIYYYFIAAK